MKVSTNGPDPKKKKAKTVTTYKVEPGKTTTVEPTFKRGKETKTYDKARTFTGLKDYGKENPNNKDAEFIEEARRKKQDIAYDKEGKPYRAGHTTVTKAADKFSADVKVGIPKITKEEKVVYEEEKPKEKERPKIKKCPRDNQRGGTGCITR
jgi:hypothetical protein